MKQIDIRAATMKLAMDQLRSIGSQLYNKQHSGVHTSATVANQIATGDWNNSYAPTSQIRSQTAQTSNKRSVVICTGSLYLNGNFAGLYDYAYISGNLTITTEECHDAWDHWFTGNQDTHWALVCVDGDFSQDNRVIIRPPVRKLGFVLNVDGDYTLNGMVSMTNRGANHSGTGDSHGYTAPVAIPVNGSITIPATGGAAGARAINTTGGTHVAGGNGGTATNGSGGGGGGSAMGAVSLTRMEGGAGSAGTCFTGGTGGGGIMMYHGGTSGAQVSGEVMDAVGNGGAGGNPPISNEKWIVTGWYEDLTVNQEIRQQGFDNYQTQDDHGMQIVGKVKDQKNGIYYIVKNSWGDLKNPYRNGYIYASEAFIRYKTISIMLHKDGLPNRIKKATKNAKW